MSDGSAFVVVVSEKFMKKINQSPLARMVSYSATGVEPNIMGIGPAKAIPKALTMADLKINNIDQIELNEAFSSQSRTLRQVQYQLRLRVSQQLAVFHQDQNTSLINRPSEPDRSYKIQ